MNNLNKTSWEHRSRQLQDNINSVIFANFPQFLNQAIHNWEFSILDKYFPQGKCAVLDAGCGYGRLSLPLSKKHKNAFFYGIDIASEYIKLFNSKLGIHGKGSVGDLSKLPYKEKSLDYVFVVTTLMYMDNKQIKIFSKEITRVLNGNGKVIVIENNKNGLDFITGFGLSNAIKNILGQKNKHFVESRVFRSGEIEGLFNQEFILEHKSGCSLLTVMIPFYLILSKVGFRKRSDLKLNANIWFLPSLYVAYVFRRN